MSMFENYRCDKCKKEFDSLGEYLKHKEETKH